MKYVICLLLLVSPFYGSAQRSSTWSIGLTNNASAYPFGILSGYLHNPAHPGLELGWSQTLAEKEKHDWFRDFHLGYFFHRFVQHGIPLYVQYGYRYKAGKSFIATAALGGGYFHSIPAVEVLKNDNGDYHNTKGIGRPQAMIAFTIGTGYRIPLKGDPLTLFLQYQVRLQTPFVRSYVPVLPYNQLALGIAHPFNHTKKN